MKHSSRIADVSEEPFKITLLLKGQTSYLADHYSERKGTHYEVLSYVNQEKYKIPLCVNSREVYSAMSALAQISYLIRFL